MKIEFWPIDKPIPYARNARTISARAVDKVAASIQEFGWRQPIVVDRKGVIVAGHTRLLAAKKLGQKKVPVHVAANLTPAQIRAYRLMDNRSHDESDWDFELLAPELLDLKAMEYDLALTGFEQAQIAELLKEGEEAKRPTLAERFGVPPFSVLDARQGYWQDRKRAWLSLGIQSELGRGGGHLEGVRDRQPN